MNTAPSNIVKLSKISETPFANKVFYKVTSAKYDERVKICDEIGNIEGVLSVVNSDDEKTAYFMCNSSPNLANRITSASKGNEVVVQYSSMDDLLKLRLLFNSLAKIYKDDQACCNLAGHLYLTKKDWQSTRQIICLEIGFSRRSGLSSDPNVVLLQVNVVSFTNVKWRHKMQFKDPSRFDRMPRYVVDGNVMRPIREGDTGEVYICHGLAGHKNNLPFMDMVDIARFEHSKMGVLYDTLKRFNRFYGKEVSLTFDTLKIAASHRPKDIATSNYVKEIIGKFDDRPLIISNCIGDDGKDSCNKLLEAFTKLDIKAEIGGSGVFGCHVLRLLKKKDEYLDSEGNSVNDPHKESMYSTNQHITPETIAGKGFKTALDVCIKEMSLKDDVLGDQIHLDDWESRNYKGTYKYIVARKENDLLFKDSLTVHPSGRMVFESIKIDPVMVSTKEDAALLIDNIEGIIVDPDDNVNLIKHTELITLPNLNESHDRVEKVTNTKERVKRGEGYRGETFRNEHLAGVIDINLVDVPTVGCVYYVGVQGYGMDGEFEHAANVREVIPFMGSRLFFEDILDQMSVPFVRHKQMTVLPFPFKYLREYTKIFGNHQ